MKKELDDSVVIPPDGQRCRSNDGKKWRCKNRIADTSIKWCEKHYKKIMDNRIKASLKRAEKRKKSKLVQTETLVENKKNGNEGSNHVNGGLEVETKEKGKIHSSCVEPRVSNRLKQKKMKKILDDHLTVNETSIQQIINHDASYGIPDCPPGFTMKRMKAEATETHFETHSKRCYEELESSAKSMKREVELENILGHYESKCIELSIELEKKKKDCLEIQGKLVDLEGRKIAAQDEFKQLKRRQERSTNSRIARLQQDQKAFLQREVRTHERISHLEEELKKIGTELKHGKRRTEDEIGLWKKKFCDLETRVLSIEKVVRF